MQESYREGVANHPDPESCGGRREAPAEALTGAHAGRLVSREITQTRVPTPLPGAEGHIAERGSASSRRTRRGRRTLACVETPCAIGGRSRGCPMTDGKWERVVKTKVAMLR